MDAALLRKHMGLKKIKGKQPGWRDWQFFEETDFVHMWSCNMSSKKFSLKAPSVSFLTPKGHFGTQTSYHSYSTITL